LWPLVYIYSSRGYDSNGFCLQVLQMIQFKLNQKPLSINQAWQGKRFKSPAYKTYEKEMLLLMPKAKIEIDQMLRIEFFFGFSNSVSDLDNPVKLLIDIAQKKYGFNDKMVFELNVRKCIVKKGEEFIHMGIYKMLPF
jgi:Holliday junction resolvase RusA-like endonuclease